MAGMRQSTCPAAPPSPGIGGAQYNRGMTSYPSPHGRAAVTMLRRGALIFAAAILLAASVRAAGAQDQRGRKYKDPPPVAHIDITVLRASNGKPVENAAVIFHTFHQGKDQGNMELKTNELGKAVLDVIPIGDEVQVQVFKSGFQTYGETFTNDQPSRLLEIKVKPPSGQYSIYQGRQLDENSQQSVTPQPTQGTAKSPSKPNQ